MDGLQIEKMIRSDKRLNKIFLGVFPRDKLPGSIKRRPSCLIANTDTSDESGQHWVAFYFDVDGTNEYFDSYGLRPMFREFRKMLNADKLERALIKINDKRLQAKNSATCGLFCIFYLFHRSHSSTSSMEAVMSLFDSRYKRNDSIVCRFAFKKFNFKHDVCRTVRTPSYCQSCVPFV
jgi:hypothetical protein